MHHTQESFNFGLYDELKLRLADFGKNYRAFYNLEASD